MQSGSNSLHQGSNSILFHYQTYNFIVRPHPFFLLFLFLLDYSMKEWVYFQIYMSEGEFLTQLFNQFAIVFNFTLVNQFYLSGFINELILKHLKFLYSLFLLLVSGPIWSSFQIGIYSSSVLFVLHSSVGSLLKCLVFHSFPNQLKVTGFRQLLTKCHRQMSQYSSPTLSDCRIRQNFSLI